MATLWRPLLILFAFLAIVVVILILLFSGGGDDTAGEDRPAAEKTDVKENDDEPQQADVKPISAKDLKVGDCITDATATTGDVTTFDSVDCDKRHDGEVYTIIKLTGEKYPGVKFVSGKGQRGCRARLRRQATPKAFANRGLGYKFVYPTPESWNQDDREITCLATFTKARTGKLAQRSGAGDE